MSSVLIYVQSYGKSNVKTRSEIHIHKDILPILALDVHCCCFVPVLSFFIKCSSLFIQLYGTRIYNVERCRDGIAKNHRNRVHHSGRDRDDGCNNNNMSNY